MNRIAAPPMAIGAAAAGCALLVLRPLLLDTRVPPTQALVVLFLILLVSGLLWPTARPSDPARRAAVATAGILAFACARLLAGGDAPHAAMPPLILLNSFAAVAEEAFFRRLLYAMLEPNGPAFAIGGSALLFSLAHVTVYGMWVLPLDLAAGLLLSWQRWASGTWRVPALTHVFANLLAVI